jgi:hypothetical protein
LQRYLPALCQSVALATKAYQVAKVVRFQVRIVFVGDITEGTKRLDMMNVQRSAILFLAQTAVLALVPIAFTAGAGLLSPVWAVIAYATALVVVVQGANKRGLKLKLALLTTELRFTISLAGATINHLAAIVARLANAFGFIGIKLALTGTEVSLAFAHKVGEPEKVVAAMRAGQSNQSNKRQFGTFWLARLPRITALVRAEHMTEPGPARRRHSRVVALMARHFNLRLPSVALSALPVCRALMVAEMVTVFPYVGGPFMKLCAAPIAVDDSHTKNLLLSGWHFLLREIHSQTGGRTEHKALYANRQSISLSNVIIA